MMNPDDAMGKPRKAKPYDEMADRMRAKLDGLPGMSEKAMMGGLCFMMDGNMLCGVSKQGYMFRMGKDLEATGLAVPGAQKMQMGAKGRTMAGFLEAKEGAGHETLDALLALSLEFVSALPPK